MCSDKINVERKRINFCTESSGAIHDEKPLILELKLESSPYYISAFNLLI